MKSPGNLREQKSKPLQYGLFWCIDFEQMDFEVLGRKRKHYVGKILQWAAKPNNKILNLSTYKIKVAET